MKKIVVRIITYNQEKEIGRALDSVLCQKEWGLYRLIVSDDCSKDHTWEILQDYHQRNPDIVYIYRNEHNLGIYGNVARAETYLPDDYDLMGTLAGDDSYCDGYFEVVQKLLAEKNIDTNNYIGIFSDRKSIDPKGSERVFHQDKVLSGYPLVSLKIRGIISSRSLLMSKSVRSLYQPILTKGGLALIEGNFDLQPHLIIKEAYYIPYVTSVYYSGIGVSTHLSSKNTEYYTTQHAEMWQYFIDHYLIDSKDLHYASYELLKANFYHKPSLTKICKMYNHYNKGQLSNIKTPFKKKIHLFLSFLKYWFYNINR